MRARLSWWGSRGASVLASCGLVVVVAAPAAASPAKPLPQPRPTVTLRPHFLPGVGPQVRMRWQDFISGSAGAQRLASLQKAITKMKSLDNSPPGSADFRRSWRYWANIHGYYGAQSPDGTVAQQVQWLQSHGMGQYVPYYQGISDQTPPDATAQAVWATCQHSGNTQAVNFFGWHRMYIYYFERVLRWAASDNTLRLPYWDYTDTTQLALPAGFRATAAVLYDQKRDPGMNAGTATLEGDSTDIDDLLPLTDYFDYELQIEEGVHGYVHCTVGPTCPIAHMGDVPVAGNDPVFYHHHANIDRMWACWQKLHGTPSGSWQNQQFSFVDETGALVTQPVSKFIDTAALGYVYDNVTRCARPSGPNLQLPAPTPLATAPKKPGPIPEEMATTMIGQLPSIAINSPAMSFDLEVPQPRLRAAVADLQRPGKVLLVLRDVTAESHPGVLFNVYLAKKGAPTVREHVGTISWFAAFRHHRGEDHPKRTYRFDVTDELRALGGSAVADTGVTVEIEATHGRKHANAAEEEADRKAAMADFHADAGLRIGAIELRAVEEPKAP